MTLYTLVEALVGIVAGLLIAIRTKKSPAVTYGKLDKAGRITNILLIPTYLILSPLYLLLGMLCYPAYDGFLGILGWIVSIIAASAGFVCAVGLGLSVALRKKGMSKASFAVQFAGVAAIALTILIYGVLAGNLLSSLN